MEIRVFGAQFFLDGFPVRRGFFLEGEKPRLLSYIASNRAGAVTLTPTQDGACLSPNDDLETVYWKKGIEISVTEKPAPQKAIAWEEFRVYGQSLRVGVREGANALFLFKGYKEACFPAKEPLHDAKIQMISGQSSAILDIRAKTEQGGYIALFSLPHDGPQKLLEGCGEIQTSGNEVTIREKQNDLRGRIVTSRYLWQGTRFSLTARTFTRASEPPFTPRTAGRLLLESILAGDDEDLLSYLAPEVADKDEIKRYFGTFDRIRDPLFSSSETAIAIQKTENERSYARTFDFSFEDGKIENITEED